MTLGNEAMIFDPEHLTDEEEEAIAGFCRASGTSRETTINMLARVARVAMEGSRAHARLAKEFEVTCKLADKWSKAARKALKARGQGKRKRGLRNPYENKPW